MRDRGKEGKGEDERGRRGKEKKGWGEEERQGAERRCTKSVGLMV